MQDWDRLVHVHIVHVHTAIFKIDISILLNCYVVSNTLATLWTVARILCPYDFSGKNTGVDGHFLLQGIFLGLSPHLLHWYADSLPLSHQYIYIYLYLNVEKIDSQQGPTINK